MKTLDDEIRHILDYDSEETVALTFECKARLVKNIVSTVENHLSQPSDVSDEDIEKYYTHRSDNPPYTDIKNINAIKGAKAMRDGQIKPTIEGERKCDDCGGIMKLVDSKSFWQCINCGNTRAK